MKLNIQTVEQTVPLRQHKPAMIFDLLGSPMMLLDLERRNYPAYCLDGIWARVCPSVSRPASSNSRYFKPRESNGWYSSLCDKAVLRAWQIIGEINL